MKFDLNDYFNLHKSQKADKRYCIVPRITCKDGFNISVQANQGAYCSPRSDEGPYTHVECGFPSEPPHFIIQYCEDPEKPTDTVYGYVPVELVEKLIAVHGGFSVQVALTEKSGSGGPGDWDYFSMRD